MHAVRGVLSGVAGGVCCFAGAIVAGLGLGGVSFFATVMGRYQPFFLLVSLLLMGFWLLQTAREAAVVDGRVRGVLRANHRAGALPVPAVLARQALRTPHPRPCAPPGDMKLALAAGAVSKHKACI